MKKVFYAVGGFFLISLIVGMCAGSEKSEGNETEQVADTSSVMDTTEEQVPEKITWKTSTSTDEMRGTTDVWTYITSDNEEYFDFPYDGGSTLRLDVRYMKKYGTDVMLTISKGQFGGNEFEGTNFVTIKFDDGELRKYYFDRADNGSMDYIFLRKKSELIALLKKAHKIMIEAPFFSTGNRVFKFHVDEPLVWEDK